MAKYYVFAWTFLLISVLCLNLYAFNILPDHFIFRHSIQIGNLIECLLFQIALIDRIREPKDLPENHISKEILRKSSDLRLGNINAEQKYAELMDLIVLNKIYRDEDLNLERVANLLKIRPDQLSALLNNKTGIHFNQWINQFRILESCELIQKFPNEPVIKIAFDVGFNSKSAFNNAFKKFKGISPSEFKTKV
jgi:AraC-like DNA-binding protein